MCVCGGGKGGVCVSVCVCMHECVCAEGGGRGVGERPVDFVLSFLLC